MYCENCRKNYTNGETRCPECREWLIPYARVTLTLTAEEAKAGGRRIIPFPGMYRPLRLSLIPGLKNRQKLSVKNARFKEQEDYTVGLVEIVLRVQCDAEEAPEAAKPVKKSVKKKPIKKGGGFWAHAAACLSVLPVTVLMTIALFYFTAKNVFEAAGKDALLVLAALSFGLLLLLRMTVRRKTDTARRNALIITVSLVLSLLIRFLPPFAGVDFASVAAKLHSALYKNSVTVTEPADETAGQEESSPAVSADPSPAATATPAAGTSSVIPNFEHRYLLNQLSPEELDNFTALYQSIASFSDVCVFPHAISRDGVDLLTTLILTECPELMQVDFTAGYYTLSLLNDRIRSMDIPYSMTKEEYTAKLSACRTFISSAVSSMEGMSTFEKEQYVYELIVKSCSYSVAGQDAANAYGALIAGHAKCDGISLAAKWLLEESGVTAVVVTGKEPDATVGHAWNAVLLDGVFCHMDVTNDVDNDGELLYPAFNVPERCLTDIYTYDEVFASRFPLPSVQGYENSWHYQAGCFIASGASVNKLIEKKGKALYKKGGGAFTLQFEDETDYLAFLSGLDGTLSSLYYDTLNAAGRYSYTTLENFRVVRISMNFS